MIHLGLLFTLAASIILHCVCWLLLHRAGMETEATIILCFACWFTVVLYVTNYLDSCERAEKKPQKEEP